MEARHYLWKVNLIWPAAESPASSSERLASSSEATTFGSGDSELRFLEHVKAYPMQTIDAVNQVLFIQHGYQCIAPEPGDPRQALLSLIYLAGYHPNLHLCVSILLN